MSRRHPQHYKEISLNCDRGWLLSMSDFGKENLLQIYSTAKWAENFDFKSIVDA